jgi:5-methylcytosine-specific restriction endonuclease McrA
VDYATYIRTSKWKAKANEAKQRSEWCCALCEERKGLEVHHRTYARLGHERMSDLIVLCWKCHRRHHGTLASGRRYWDEHQQMLPFTARVPAGADLN